ncbi:hypothetical protein BDZ89DRAFT_1068023 [Hymenopellis radicata]|nr:hypothetical protein BDZ89DRAFT_1068023 [Hymenopellis radicata]
MSLSSLLLASASKKDAELDALFSNAPPVAGPSTMTQKKRKNEAVELWPEKKKKIKGEAKKEKVEKQKKVAKHKDVSDEESDGPEEAYEHAKVKPVSQEEENDSDGDPSTLVHESTGKSPSDKKKKGKFVPPDETSEQRNQRTIFVGNLPIEVAEKKAGLKQLKRHILSFVPDATIESVRFRSIAFQTPTSKLPDEDDEKVKSKPDKKKAKEKIRAHDRERTSAWKDDEGDKGDEKKFLTPGQKKRIAFINHDFHSSASSVNAYVVFAHLADAPDASPYEAAQLAAEKCNGTTFMERFIRVDVVGKPDAVGDPKLSVFVGNLDFASKEEDLRVFFEGVMSAERGPPPEGSTWVTRVRIVRDRETQLGKGFAYVQFSDKQCVDELIALEEGKVRFAKRKLRVQRCKNLTGKATASTTATTAPAPTAKAPVTVRAGDPTLGDRLAHLDKDARKKVKSTDADRVARRLEKKKARNALAKDGVKMRDRVRKKTTGFSKAKPAASKPVKRVRSEQSLSKRNMKK